MEENNEENDFRMLEKVSMVILEKLRHDEQTNPDLEEQCRQRSQRYYVEPYKSLWGGLVEHTEFLPMPRTIVEHCSSIECASFMGLIPEINRAWITADNKLFLWNYATTGEFELFEELSDVIVSVCVSAPKPGIFQDSVKYVLAVATPLTVVLLAISCGDKDRGSTSLRLIPTAFNLLSDNVTMFKMVGSQCGRLFMAGNDGNLYELEYSNADSSWAALLGSDEQQARKCRKINHHAWKWKVINIVPPFLRALAGAEESPLSNLAMDDSRHVLYALSDNSSLSVFYLGAADKDMVNIVESFNVIKQTREFLSHRDVPESSPTSIQFRDPSAPGFNIIGMYPINVTESKKVHLLVVLGNGIRIYLSLKTRDYMGEYYEHIPAVGRAGYTAPPASIQVTYVRSPPSDRCLSQSMPDVAGGKALGGGGGGGRDSTDLETGSVPAYNASNPLRVGASFYASGVLLMAAEKPKQPDELWACFEDLVTRTGLSMGSHPEKQAVHPTLREGVTQVLGGRFTGGGKIFDIRESCAVLHQQDAQLMRTLFFCSRTFASQTSTQTFTQKRLGPSYINAGDSTGQQGYAPSEVPATFAPAIAPHGQPRGVCLGYDPAGLDQVALLGELAHQHIPCSGVSLQRKFVVLTGAGLQVLSKIRPVDILQRTLSQQTHQSDEMCRYLRDSFGEKQFCAMSVLLACGVPGDAGDKAPNVGFDPSIHQANGGMPPESVQARAISTVIAITDGASYKRSDSTAGAVVGDARVVLSDQVHDAFQKSSLHDGLHMALSRILRPIWLRTLVDKRCRLSDIFKSSSLIVSIRSPLRQLMKLLKGYYQLAVTSDPQALNYLDVIDNLDPSQDMMTQRMHRQTQMRSNPDKMLLKQAKALEDQSINHLYRLVSRSAQALSFIEVVLQVQKQWPTVVIDWKGMAEVTFQAFVTSRRAHEQTKKMVDEIIFNITRHKHANMALLADQVIEQLGRDCYHFFSPSDRLNYQASKLLDSCHNMIASQTGNRFGGLGSDDAVGQDAQLRQMSLQCVELVLRCARHWRSVECVWDAHPANKVAPGGASALSARCKELQGLGQTGRDGIPQLCFVAARNFTTRSQRHELSVTFPAAANKEKDGQADSEFWDAGLYHGGTVASEKDRDQALLACYECLAEQIVAVGEDCFEPGHGVVRAADAASQREAGQSAMRRMVDSAMALSQDCRDFHIILYAKLLSAGHESLLLNIRSAFIEDFLRDENVLLLYNYYAQHAENLRACLLMTELAKTDSPLAVATRIEYLSKAISSAEKAGASVAGMLDSSRAANRATNLMRGNNSAVVGNAVGAAAASDVATAQFVSDHLSELRDLLDVAVYQRMVHAQLAEDLVFQKQSAARGRYSEAQKAQLEKMEAVVGRLQLQLLSITELFHDICMPYRLWDMALYLLNAARVDDDELVARLWRSLIYRIVPEAAQSEEVAAFLAYKRQADGIDTYARYQQSRNTDFESADQWLPVLEGRVVQLGRELVGAAGGRDPAASSAEHASAYTASSIAGFPTITIVEELEELCCVLSSRGVPVRRGVSAQCCYEIGIGHATLMEAYVEIFDRWTGKAPDKLLQVLQSSSLCMLEWSGLAREQSSRHVKATRDLKNAIQAGRVRAWLERMWRHVSTLGTRQLSAPHMKLLENTSNEFFEVDRRINELTWN